MLNPSLQKAEPVELTVRPSGQKARSVFAHGLLTALMFISPLMVFIPAALLHCGLRNGRRAAWVALAIGIAASAVFFIVPGSKSTDTIKMGYAYLMALVAGVALPALATLPLVERGLSFGRVLTTALLGSTLGLGLTETVMRTAVDFSPHAYQVMNARESVARVVTFYRTANAPADMIRMVEKSMSYAIVVLPASLLMYSALAFILSLMMLGRLRVWREHAAAHGEPSTLYFFRSLSLPEWMAVAFLIGGLTPLVSGMMQTIAANVLAIVAFLYFMQGLSIFRAFVAGMPAMGTLFSYMALIFLTVFGVAPLLLSVAGLFDTFFDFRNFNRKDHSDESHSD